MVVEYKVADMGYVRYYLAPKASTGQGCRLGQAAPLSWDRMWLLLPARARANLLPICSREGKRLDLSPERARPLDTVLPSAAD